MSPQEARDAGRLIASKVFDYGEVAPHGLAREVIREMTRAIDGGTIPRAMAAEALRGAADHFEAVAKLIRQTVDEIEARDTTAQQPATVGA